MSIHAVGVSVDTTLRRFIERAVATGHEVVFVDLHQIVRHPWRFVLEPGDESAILHDDAGRALPLPRDGRYYARVVDLSPVLPAGEGRAWRHLVDALLAYLDSIPGPVVNRPGAQSHNGTKPLHEWWLSARGFLVPASLTTSSPDRLRSFLSRRGPAIVKAVSGTRGVAQLVRPGDLADFEPAAGPVHLQEWIDGFDVRVHLVDGQAFAERIDSDSVDYREKDATTRHRAVDVPTTLVSLMDGAAKEMGLLFTGWDFRVDHAGRWWCLEVNPMPGYGSYDRRCAGAISAALCRVLES
ncbi:RimK family alpha-L-glutamate ligase [Microbispora sp. H10830]|uniref:ATP-grasp domain-containing protein n=1 Tax=Microbispora sp. H10830 TaxID=2729109 RepID=UPI0016017FC2|nr:hypothetical protein [Microbispora sp. H10830]